MSTSKPFTHQLNIQPADIDALGHVNNVVYVRWVQEVAAAHWQKMASAALQMELVWVVLRHEIDYHAPAVLGDSIEGSTRVGDYKGARFERYVFIRNKQTAQLLAEAKTVWVLLDAKTLRPKRIQDELVTQLLAGNLS